MRHTFLFKPQVGKGVHIGTKKTFTGSVSDLGVIFQRACGRGRVVLADENGSLYVQPFSLPILFPEVLFNIHFPIF